MAYKSRRYECPTCQNQFDYLHTVTDGVEDPPPLYCPIDTCGAYVGEEPEPIPYFRTIGKRENKTQDMVYRQMETASIRRAEEAASMLGVPTAEMSSLKITDMKDNLREGDTSSKMPMPSSAMPTNIPVVNHDVGNATARLAMTQGPAAGRNGDSTLDRLVRKDHSQRARAVQKLGQTGYYQR